MTDKSINLLKYFRNDKLNKSNAIVNLRKAMVTSSIPFNFLNNSSFKDFLAAVGVAAPSHEQFVIDIHQMQQNADLLVKDFVAKSDH
jgi:hypothetical protein